MKDRKRTIVFREGWDFGATPQAPIFTVIELHNVFPNDALYVGAELTGADILHYFEQGDDFIIKG